jgi:DNA-binding transcriptional regulator YiaG
MLQYKGCGLSNVYLLNGYERQITNSGTEVLHIEDIEGLHRTIALSMVVNPVDIDGAQFRFLRKEIGMSQRFVAEGLGVQEQTVSLWERGEHPLPQYASVFICALIHEYLLGQPAMRSVIDRAREADKAEARRLLVSRSDQGEWQAAA